MQKIKRYAIIAFSALLSSAGVMPAYAQAPALAETPIDQQLRMLFPTDRENRGTLAAALTELSDSCPSVPILLAAMIDSRPLQPEGDEAFTEALSIFVDTCPEGLPLLAVIIDSQSSVLQVATGQVVGSVMANLIIEGTSSDDEKLAALADFVGEAPDAVRASYNDSFDQTIATQAQQQVLSPQVIEPQTEPQIISEQQQLTIDDVVSSLISQQIITDTTYAGISGGSDLNISPN